MGELAELLAVDDDRGDLLLLQVGLAEWKTPHRLNTVPDVDAALAFLRRDAWPRTAPADLVLLDLDLRGRRGFEVLRVMRSEPRLKRIPALVISGSPDPADERRAYAEGADAFLAKPCGLDGLLSSLRAVELYWRALERERREADDLAARSKKATLELVENGLDLAQTYCKVAENAAALDNAGWARQCCDKAAGNLSKSEQLLASLPYGDLPSLPVLSRVTRKMEQLGGMIERLNQVLAGCRR